MKKLRYAILIGTLGFTFFACKDPQADVLNVSTENALISPQQVAQDEANLIAVTKNVLDVIQNTAIVAEIKRVVDKKLELGDDEFVTLLHSYSTGDQANILATPLLYKAMEQSLGLVNKKVDFNNQDAGTFALIHPLEVYWAYSKYWNGTDPIAVAYVTKPNALNKSIENMVGFIKIGGVIQQISINEEYMMQHSVMIIKDAELTFIAEKNLQSELSNTKNITTEASKAGAGATLFLYNLDADKAGWKNFDNAENITYRRYINIQVTAGGSVQETPNLSIIRHFITNGKRRTGVYQGLDPIVRFKNGKGNDNIFYGLHYGQAVSIKPVVTDAFKVGYIETQDMGKDALLIKFTTITNTIASRLRGLMYMGVPWHSYGVDLKVTTKGVTASKHFGPWDVIENFMHDLTNIFQFAFVGSLDMYTNYDSMYVPGSSPVTQYGLSLPGVPYGPILVLEQGERNFKAIAVWKTSSPAAVLTPDGKPITIPYSQVLESYYGGYYIPSAETKGYSIKPIGAVEVKKN